MRRLILSSVAAVATCVGCPAGAADLPAKMPLKAAPFVGCGPARFSGAYIGGNVGAIAYTGVRQDQDGFLAAGTVTDYTHTKLGATAGVQAGWDWQSCNAVLGIVADWNWADTDTAFRISPTTPGIDATLGGQIKWFSTIRGRAGIAVDDMLFYVTGGLAVADIDIASNRIVAGAPPVSFSVDHTRLGLVVGAGAEYAIARHWSVNAEVLYLQFAKQSDTIAAPALAVTPFAFESQDKAWVTRVGLNYRWNDTGPAAPVPYAGGAGRFGGFHVGGNVGSVSYTALRGDQDAFFSTGDFSTTKTSATGGLQVGWDWQHGAKLVGVVADFNWANTEAFIAHFPNTLGNQEFTSSTLKWFGTVRGRAGLTLDDVLIYVTGGVAYARIDTTFLRQFAGFAEERASFRDTRWGFVGGVGTEFALGGGWSVTSELLYMQFNKDNVTFRNPFGFDFSFENNDSAWVSRFGLNYRWNDGGAAAPAPAARYAGPPRFDGFYIGGNAGVVSYTALHADQDGYLLSDSQYTASTFAGTVGGQVGWDWQKGHRLFGVVADLNWVNAEATSRLATNLFGNPTLDMSNSSEMSWFATLRTRGGLVVDNVLVYLTGGLAAAEIKNTYTLRDPSGANFPGANEQFSFSTTRWGWTGGIGAEYAFANHWSVSGEVLYMQFRRHTDSFHSVLKDRDVQFEANDSAWVARAGLNYRFNHAPVVAKY